MSDNGMPPRGRLREHVAEELRVLLARRRMSAAELARRAGIKQSTMSRRMTGETAFDMDDLEAIAAVLEIEVSDLIPKTVSTGRALNEHKARPVRSDEAPALARPLGGPFGGGRRDSTRPVSAVPANRRRPQVVRAANRPRPA